MIRYCKRCAVDLRSATGNRCAKCGRLFNPSNPRSYNTSQDPSLYRPWYRFSRYPIIWSGAAIITCLTTVLVGNGIHAVAYDAYTDFANPLHFGRLPNQYLLALWGMLLIPLLALRNRTTLRTWLISTAPPLFALAAAAAMVVNQMFDQHDMPGGAEPYVHYVTQGLPWSAICLWSIAWAIGWQPFLRTAICLLVMGALLAYWYLLVFPPLEKIQATHPMTFVSSVPFFLTFLIPMGGGLWSLKKPAKKRAKGAAGLGERK